MKKLQILVAVIAVLGVVFGLAPTLAHAGTVFSVEASTYPITEAETCAAQIQGDIDISNISFSNSGTTAQTVIMYELGDDTNTVSAVATFVIPATAGFYRPWGDLNYNDRIRISDVMFRKSSTSTSVYVTGIYQ